MPKAKIKDKRYVLLDTNIISSFSNQDLGNKLLSILQEVVQLGYGIAISDVTYFEIINGTSVETEVKMMTTLNGVDRFFVMKDILIAAGHLGALYIDEKLPLDQFGACDQIIAATAILHNCIIFTKNGRDFPMPFFKELDRRWITYKTGKNQDVCIPFYFLEPQLEHITKCYTDKLSAHQQKAQKREADKKQKGAKANSSQKPSA